MVQNAITQGVQLGTNNALNFLAIGRQKKERERREAYADVALFSETIKSIKNPVEQKKQIDEYTKTNPIFENKEFAGLKLILDDMAVAADDRVKGINENTQLMGSVVNLIDQITSLQTTRAGSLPSEGSAQSRGEFDPSILEVNADDTLKEVPEGSFLGAGLTRPEKTSKLNALEKELLNVGTKYAASSDKYSKEGSTLVMAQIRKVLNRSTDEDTKLFAQIEGEERAKVSAQNTTNSIGLFQNNYDMRMKKLEKITDPAERSKVRDQIVLDAFNLIQRQPDEASKKRVRTAVQAKDKDIFADIEDSSVKLGFMNKFRNKNTALNTDNISRKDMLKFYTEEMFNVMVTPIGGENGFGNKQEAQDTLTFIGKMMGDFKPDKRVQAAKDFTEDFEERFKGSKVTKEQYLQFMQIVAKDPSKATQKLTSSKFLFDTESKLVTQKKSLIGELRRIIQGDSDADTLMKFMRAKGLTVPKQADAQS